jgi:hypothetical protein
MFTCKSGSIYIREFIPISNSGNISFEPNIHSTW